MGEERRILRLGAQGDGISEEGALYVPYTLPGERVLVAADGARARLERVLEPSAERVAPPCPHFGRCGGCAVQHASDAAVAAWKTGILEAALASRGIEGVAILPPMTVPAGARRRIAVSARRTKKSVQIGFHAPASDEIVEVPGCLVAHPRLVETLPGLAEIVRAGASRKGALRITLTLSEAGVDAAVTEAKALAPAGLAALAGAAARSGLARLSWNGEVAVCLAEPVQRFGRARVVPPPGGFLQPTAEGETALLEAVREAVGGARRIADLFSGSGTFALPLAESAEVLAVEGDAGAVAALEAGWRGAPGLHRVAALRRDLFERPLMPAEMRGLDAVVLDPPRAGARAQAAQLATGGPPRIAYVSCNPATFARDARVLVDGGYRLDRVQPVDQFRWSPHLELMAAFVR